MAGDRRTRHAHAVALSAEQPMRSAYYVLWGWCHFGYPRRNVSSLKFPVADGRSESETSRLLQTSFFFVHCHLCYLHNRGRFPCSTLPCGSAAEVGPNMKRMHTFAACDHFRLVGINGWRFDGVVGYRICLTHRRPPVRARVEPFLYHSHLIISAGAHIERA